MLADYNFHMYRAWALGICRAMTANVGEAWGAPVLAQAKWVRAVFLASFPHRWGKGLIGTAEAFWPAPRRGH